MTNPFDVDTGEFVVLMNAEGQYSLWPAFRELPSGWTPAGTRGERQHCLEWIETHWTDLRPRSLIDTAYGSST